MSDIHDDFFKDPDQLNVHISNTLSEAVNVLEGEANILKDVKDGELPNSHLVSTRINLLKQKNLLKELRKLLSFYKNNPVAN